MPSLVSIWSSAPFLHNNALGEYNGDPRSPAAWRHSTMPRRSCSGRRSVSVRLRSGGRRTNATCTCGRNLCQRSAGLAGSDGYIKIGPIPKGTPINLLANLEARPRRAGRCSNEARAGLLKIKLDESFDGTSHCRLLKAVPSCSPRTSAPTSSRTKATTTARSCPTKTSAR